MKPTPPVGSLARLSGKPGGAADAEAAGRLNDNVTVVFQAQTT
jgi:hypothetical protein